MVYDDHMAIRVCSRILVVDDHEDAADMLREYLEAMRGQTEVARAQLEQATAEFVDMHDQVGMTTALMYWLDITWYSGAVEDYARLLGALYGKLVSHRQHRPDYLSGVLHEHWDAARERLGAERFDALCAEGSGLSIEAALATLDGLAARQQVMS